MDTDQQPSGFQVTIPPRTLLLEGDLPYSRRLISPLAVLIEDDDGEVLVSEPRFHMHAGGPTEAEAVAAFKRILSGYVDVLEAREGTLGGAAREQLAYLRSIIGPA